MTKKPTKQSKIDELRELALADLEVFIRLVNPDRALGKCHSDLISWWTRQEAKSHQLVLLPRDHQKSALVAYRVAWAITKNPAVRVLYISSTAKLATKQLKMIKDILTCDNYRYYWPEMVNVDESKREKWTETEISVDHPIRRARMVRDPTVFVAGLTTNIVGMHCDIAVLDDVVVDDNAYSDENRDKVRNQAGYLASIAGTEALLWAVGTRYHPLDLYNDFMSQIVEIRDPESGEIVESWNLYEVYEKQVEDAGDGTGNFLWPRQKGPNGLMYGFNTRELAIKKAQYPDPGKFYAQYYNNPNDVSTATIKSDMFQYYERSKLKRGQYGGLFYGDLKLNVFASIDFAYSLARSADYTAIVVVGVDAHQNYYVLDIDRFKTDQTSEYYKHIIKMHDRWGFNKIRAEVTAAQSVIVKDLKENYIRANGLALSVDEYRPSRQEGSKEERIEAILQPRYANKQMWHYSGGNCAYLEEELSMRKPPHDDIKDSLASCIDICVPPSQYQKGTKVDTTQYVNPRFGGIG